MERQEAQGGGRGEFWGEGWRNRGKERETEAPGGGWGGPGGELTFVQQPSEVRQCVFT